MADNNNLERNRVEFAKERLVDLTPASDTLFKSLDLSDDNPSMEGAERVGIEIWKTYGKTDIQVDPELVSVAGIYLAFIGTAQNVPPDDLERMKAAEELQSPEGKRVSEIASVYLKLLESKDPFEAPSIKKILAGEKLHDPTSNPQVIDLQNKIWESFKQ